MTTLTDILRTDWTAIETWQHMRGALSMAARRLRTLASSAIDPAKFEVAAKAMDAAAESARSRTGRIGREAAKANLFRACQYLEKQGIND